MRLSIENELRYAIAGDEFSLHYQPLLDVLSGEVTGIEALLRWYNPFFGNVPPLEFVPIAEESGLIISIGEWVIRSACEQARLWYAAGICPERIAINVSVHQIAKNEFPERVSKIIQATGLDASLLEFEITETVLLQDTTKTLDTLNRLRMIGVKIAIDDFGTGFSGLSYLRKLPIDRIKIDRTLIESIQTNAKDQAIVNAIIAMAKSMNLGITAEGVETGGQIRCLQDGHCEEAQGYFFSHPLPAEKAERFLRYYVREKAASA